MTPKHRLAATVALAVLLACGGSPSPSVPPPTGLLATVETRLGIGTVHLSWSAVVGASGYRVWYGVGPLSDQSASITTGGTSLDLSPLEAGQTYQVAVSTVAPAGPSGRSSILVVTPPIPPSIPEGLAATAEVAGGSVVVHVSWAAVAGATSYVVFHDSTTITDASPSEAASGTSLDLTGLQPSQACQVAVVAVAPGASSPRSDPFAVTFPIPPPAPEGLAAIGETVLGEGLAHVSWSATPRAERYKVSWDVAAITGASPGASTTATSLDLPGLLPGQAYQVTVVAENAWGPSPAAAAVVVAPPVPPAPPADAALAVVDHYGTDGALDAVQVTLSGTAPPGGSLLLIRSDDGGATWRVRGTATETIFLDPLTAGETCSRLRFRLAAVVPGASSAPSASEAVRGTLLASSTETANFTTAAAQSPYFVRGTVSLDTSWFTLGPQTVLCIGAGDELSLVDGAQVLFYGAVRLEGTAGSPARVTAHAPGGGPLTQGLIVGTSTHWDDDVSANHDPDTGRGSLIEFAQVDGLQALSLNSRPRIRESKFTALGGPHPFVVDFLAPDLEDSTFDGFWFSAMGSYAAEPRSGVRRVRFLNGGAQGAAFAGFDGTGKPADTFAPGQFSGNELSGPTVSVSNFSASGAMLLGGNYWGGGSPAVLPAGLGSGVEVTADFAPVLSAPPSAGATW